MIGREHYSAEYSVELEALSRGFNARSALPSQLVSNDGHLAVWEILLPNQPATYMSAKSTHSCDDEKWVVHVDANRFYYHWLKTYLEEQLRGLGGEKVHLFADLKSDYKYDQAHEGATQGIDNPVPLADVNFWDRQEFDRITFSNGITRTFWLLANRADSFPIATGTHQEAKDLHDLAGVGAAPMSYEELFR